LKPLRLAQPRQPEAAGALLRLVNRQCVPRDGGAEFLDDIARSHGDDAGIGAIPASITSIASTSRSASSSEGSLRRATWGRRPEPGSIGAESSC
jgi:hypothetical protein